MEAGELLYKQQFVHFHVIYNAIWHRQLKNPNTTTTTTTCQLPSAPPPRRRPPPLPSPTFLQNLPPLTSSPISSTVSLLPSLSPSLPPLLPTLLLLLVIRPRYCHPSSNLSLRSHPFSPPYPPLRRHPTRKQLLFPNNWPLGHEIEDDEDSAATPGAESFCLDSSCSTGSTNDLDLDLDLDPLREFTREMEKLGLKVLEELASAVGFENPAPEGLQSQLWISGGTNKPGRVYPYVLGLHYQIRSQKQSLLSDSGWVWSNGKLQKVRGRPSPSLDDANNNPHCIMMSLLITLPVDSTVSPLIPDLVENEEGGEHDSVNNNREQRLFNSFSFEDYAWRVYHEHLHMKDPLVRYRV
ncbi:hypothetical protein Sango_2658500 [Sesamum angolense]|uniref:Uncharacterized protein n=1 Tax=Sesamum angolense TaxID=2727404 RepID=A0AAE1W230_9LAMI|nr:hypothetical protein Sango_2658500 [Sesamum angolense]